MLQQMQQQAPGVAGPFACYPFCMIRHEGRLLPMCVQGHIVFRPGNAKVKDYPTEMMHALPLSTM